MTKTELQVALAAAIETSKRTAGVFLDALGNLAYKATKKVRTSLGTYRTSLGTYLKIGHNITRR